MGRRDRRWQVRMIRRDDGLWYAEVEGQVERGGLRDLCMHDLTMAYARKAAAIREVRRLVHAWLKMQRRTAA